MRTWSSRGHLTLAIAVVLAVSRHNNQKCALADAAASAAVVITACGEGGSACSSNGQLGQRQKPTASWHASVSCSFQAVLRSHSCQRIITFITALGTMKLGASRAAPRRPRCQ